MRKKLYGKAVSSVDAGLYDSAAAVRFYYGFTSSDGTFTFSNITAIFEKIHIQALGLSLLLAVITTVVCLLFAYPLALILSKSAAKNRSFVIFIFILPMWINFLLRIIAIRMLLSDNGYSQLYPLGAESAEFQHHVYSGGDSYRYGL